MRPEPVLREPFRKRLAPMKARCSRYIGLDRTRLQHVATAAAINVARLANWLQESVPLPHVHRHS